MPRAYVVKDVTKPKKPLYLTAAKAWSADKPDAAPLNFFLAVKAKKEHEASQPSKKFVLDVV